MQAQFLCDCRTLKLNLCDKTRYMPFLLCLVQLDLGKLHTVMLCVC